MKRVKGDTHYQLQYHLYTKTGTEGTIIAVIQYHLTSSAKAVWSSYSILFGVATPNSREYLLQSIGSRYSKVVYPRGKGLCNNGNASTFDSNRGSPSPFTLFTSFYTKKSNNFSSQHQARNLHLTVLLALGIRGCSVVQDFHKLPRNQSV